MSNKSEFSHYLASSVLVRFVRRSLVRFRGWTTDSLLVGVAASVEASIDTAANRSALVDLLRTLVRWVQCSALYGWFTETPATTPVVVDARRSSVVGPLISFCSILGPRLERAWHTCLVNRLTERSARSVRDAPVRMTSITVITAILTNTALTALAGELSRQTIVTTLVALTVAIAGTRVRTSWDCLAQSLFGRILARILQPPEPRERGK